MTQTPAWSRVVLFGAYAVSVLCITPGCEQEQVLPTVKPVEKTTRISPPTPAALPPNHPPISGADAAPATKVISHDGVLRLTGIEMSIPEGWVQEAIQPRPMAPVAVFRLPAKSKGLKDGAVRITYFPGMKGMDEQNIERWVRQITMADGKPATRDDAKTETVNLENVRITTVDVTGVMRMSSGMPGEGNTVSNSRLIAAIVDHPVGPHFVKATGDAATIEAWAGSIEDFLKSTQTK